MVAAFDYCLHGKGGAAPSIDTAMHGLVDAAHVDHLHPDSGIAIATAADGEALTKEIFGDKVVWVPWRRPGFQLGLDIAAIKDENPQAVGCILGGHGITAWGDDLGGVRGQLAVDHRHRRGLHRRAHQGRAVRAGAGRLRRAAGDRAAGQGGRAGADAAVDRLVRTGRWSGTSPTTTWCWTSWPRPSTRGWPRWAPRCPDHFLRTKVKPLVLDLPADASRRGLDRPAAGAARGVPGRLPGATTTATPTAGLARPSAAPTRLIILIPGRGHVLATGKDKQTARVAGEFYLNAINVMRGAEGAVHVRADRRGARSSGSSTGRWRRPSCSGCPSRSRWPPGSRWSPAPPRASARPSPPGSPPRAPAW